MSSATIIDGPTAPRLADGVELFGEYEAGGFVEPTYLAGRLDGQVVQLSRLLYLVARHLDGEADLTTVAERVSADYGRPVSHANATFLVEQRLAPLGLIAPKPGETAPAPVATALFSLGLRAALVPARVVGVLTRPFLFLFRTPIVLAVLAVLVILDVWLFAVRGISSELIAVLTDPALLIALAALQYTSLAFHELGHAAACRYGGAKPGRIGAGIFLIWPVFYSDVTDSYRLNRAGRLRTDLAGVYFDAVATLVIAGAYLITGNELFLVAVVFQHIDMVYQFVPFVRLDGYYMVSDLVGVPDLYGRIRPILRSLRRGRAPQPAVTELRPRVRVIVTVWVLSSVTVIIGGLGLLVVNTPAWFAKVTVAFGRYADQAQASWAGGDLLGAGFSMGRAALLFVPALGTVYMISRLVRLRRRARAAGNMRSKAVECLTSPDADGRLSLDPAKLAAYPFARQWRGYDCKEVDVMMAAVARRLTSPPDGAASVGARSVGASDDEQRRPAGDALVLEPGGQEPGGQEPGGQERRREDEKVQVTMAQARQIYEEAAEEATRMRVNAERHSAEILEAARRQFETVVELKLELRRYLDEHRTGADEHRTGDKQRGEPDQHRTGAGLRIVADRADDPSIAS